jgi:hypothetical protein
MGVPNLSDGNPLSYEWLNQVADAINKLEVQNSDDSNVKFVGLISGQDVQVLTGSKKVNITADGVQFQVPNIKFDTPFVVAIVQTTTSNDDAFPAAVGISNITATEFDAVVQTFTTGKKVLGKKGKSFNIRYIAVGKKQVIS